METELPFDDLEGLYENAPCGYILTTPDGVIVRVNQTFLTQAGYQRADILNTVTFQELMSRPGRVFYDTHFGPLIRLQGFVKEIACDLVRPDGTKLPVLVNGVLVKDAQGEPSTIRFTVFDATERRRYEADLLAARRRAEHYQVIVETSADSIISVGADGSIQTWNRGAEKMFGYAAQDAIGKKVWKLVNLSGRAARLRTTVDELRSGRPVYIADYARVRDGSEIYATISLTPHIEPPGELTSISAIIRDVTERKRMADAGRRQELLQNLVESQEAERQRIARDLHDHFGQQLTALRLALTGLRLNDGEHGEQIDAIEAQALQIDRDLSFFSFELRPTILDEVGLAGALSNFVDEWSRNFSIAADFHGPRESSKRFSPTLEINLYRIVQEALNNILKHAGASRVSVILDVAESGIALIIEDDGKGFVVGDTSASIKTPGHGLGLKGMNERAGILKGTLEIQSQPNAGTTIFIRVPVDSVSEAL